MFIFRKAGDDSDYTCFVGENNLILATLFSALLLGIGERFFHKNLNNNVFDEKPNHPTLASHL